MSRKIVAAELFDEVEVDLWGYPFELVETTLKVEQRLDEYLKRISESQENEDDPERDASTLEVAELYGDMLNIALKPLEGPEGKKTQAKTVLLKMLKDDKIGRVHIEALVERIQDMAVERTRPTSPPQTNGSST